MRRLLVLLLSLLPSLLPGAALAQTPPAAPGHPGWTPAGNDCFVWNRSPAEGETATWSGPCVDRHASGSGTLLWESPAGEQRYEGEMRNGRLDGKGTYVFSTGARYEGGFKDDDFDGTGTFTEAGVRYEGGWRAGHKDGHGVLSTMNGDRYDGTFAEDQMTGSGSLTVADGRTYVGGLHNGRPDGKGTLTDATGTFDGTWVDGCFNDGKRRAAFGIDPAQCK